MSLTPSAPYEITFRPDSPPPPSRIDHSQSDPGPSDGKRRAGYTTYTLGAKMTVKRNGNPGPPELLYFDSVAIDFFLKDFMIQVSSDYGVGSCPYRATCEHEFASHVHRPIRLFLAKRDAVVQRFSAFPLPAQKDPRTISKGQEDAIETQLIQPVRQLIITIKTELKTMLENDRVLQDDANHYQSVYAKCRPDDWRRAT
jgi:hypothetical protein